MPFDLSFAKIQREAGIWVPKKSWPGSATMASIASASTMARRMSPSPDCMEDIEPFASTTPATPVGDRW